MTSLWASIDLWLNGFTYWYWFGFAAVLLIFEMLGAGGFLFWTGLSAVFTGLLLWIIPSLIWPLQFLIFAVVAVIFAIGWVIHIRRNPIVSDRPRLNKRNEQYIDRIFTLDEAVVNQRGMVFVDDSRWRIKCDHDLPAGTKVIIVGVDGVILIAERYQEKSEQV